MTTEAIFKLLKGERLLWLRLKKHTEYTECTEYYILCGSVHSAFIVSCLTATNKSYHLWLKTTTIGHKFGVNFAPYSPKITPKSPPELKKLSF